MEQQFGTPQPKTQMERLREWQQSLHAFQNECLRVVARAYRATPIQTLEVETHVLPMDLYLNSRLATFLNRLVNSEAGRLIEKACSTIQARIRNKRGRKTPRKIATNEQRRKWTEKRAEWIQQNHPTSPTTHEKQKVLEA
jgi:hypothetical protein